MKRPRHLAAALFVLGAAATAFAALAFANNVAVVARQWGVLARTGFLPSESGGPAGGFLPWLDWAAIDLSCATTFIPLLGFLLATAGAWRVLRGRPAADPERFPFFRSYDQLNVALGLIGTLWGVILIGWHDLEDVSMRDLMSCLHTALFSTLMAVVWVYLVDHPLLRPLFRALLRDAGLDGAARERVPPYHPAGINERGVWNETCGKAAAADRHAGDRPIFRAEDRPGADADASLPVGSAE